jgi:hypothetical protein
MQRYIEQLIEDLDLAANNPPEPAYIEAPPQFDDFPTWPNWRWRRLNPSRN